MINVDRATVVTTAIVQMITRGLASSRGADLAVPADEVAAYLRDEFADIERTVRDEIRVPDD
jgi:hypothetical protein